ncbi:MAG: proline--tRNA ligase [Candidatus Syntropharchaeia archaeon]
MEFDKEKNFSEWYNEVLRTAEIMDVRYPVKGLYVWFPFGFALRRGVYNILRSLLDKDHQETLFPLLIPKTEFMKEEEHIKGFENEVYWVTKGGGEELDVPLALRPTSETAIYPMFKVWIRSHADLPLRIYQIVNTFRHETKHTRPLIRLREITSFKEAHTAHTTWEDAKTQVEIAIEIYKNFYDRLAIPHLITQRPDWDKFPGADYTIAFDTIMPDGRTLQIGTIHHLGTNFSKTFDILYEDIDGERKYVNQTCYGISERCIAALISVHGDSRGLVLLPEIAPIQIVIVPIIFSEMENEVMEFSKRIYNELISEGFRVTLDDRDERPGAKYYRWELKGVPLRIEIGPKDIRKNSVLFVRRDNFQKRDVSVENLISGVRKVFEEMYVDMYEKEKKIFKSKIKDCTDLDQIKRSIEKGVARINWCEDKNCGLGIEEEVGTGILGKSIDEKSEGKCPFCGKETDIVAYVSRTY